VEFLVGKAIIMHRGGRLIIEAMINKRKKRTRRGLIEM
jgi:hypothetical protein